MGPYTRANNGRILSDLLAGKGRGWYLVYPVILVCFLFCCFE